MYGAWIAKGMYLKERIVLFLFFPILELLGTCLHLMLSRTSSQYERMEDILQVHRIGLPRQLNSVHGEGVEQLGVEATTTNGNSISNGNVLAVRISTPWDIRSVFLQPSTTNRKPALILLILSCLDVIPSAESPPICKPRRNYQLFLLRRTLGLNPDCLPKREALVLRALCPDLDGDEVIPAVQTRPGAQWARIRVSTNNGLVMPCCLWEISGAQLSVLTSL